jgi:hypothetical protein
MSVLEEYLKKAQELKELRARTGTTESPEDDELTDSMDPLWWAMSEEERAIADLAHYGSWIRRGGERICPFCGNRTEGQGCPPRCASCMRDVIPEEVT